MIERLDARARHWPPLAKAAYAALKGLLLLLGAWIVVRLSWERFGLWGSLAVWGGFFGWGLWRGRSTASRPPSTPPRP